MNIHKLKHSSEIQGPHVIFFTLLVMLGNCNPTSIVTIKMVTKVVAGELLKIRYNFHYALRESWLNPFIVEASELIKIRYNFHNALCEFWADKDQKLAY